MTIIKNENNTKTLKWVYSASKHYLPLVFLITLISTISAVSFVALALLTKGVLDTATGAAEGSIKVYGSMLFVVVVLQVVLSGFQTYLNTYTSGKLTVALRERLFTTVCRKKYSELTQYHSGDLLNRFTSDVDVVVTATVSIIPSIASMLAKIISGVGAMLLMEPIIAVAILVIGVTVPAIGRVINKRYKRIHKECQKSEGVSRSFLQECFANIVVIKTFESERPFINRLNKYMGENFRLKLKRIRLSVITNLSLYAFFTAGYYAVLLWGAVGLAAGSLTYDTLSAFLQLISQLRAPLQNVSGIMPQYYSMLASAERLTELENCTNEKPPLAFEKAVALKKDFKTLEVNNVSFSYDSDDILKDCSFTIEHGGITAITGESGSGKSTVFKLILGLYEPQSGNITINGNIPLDTSMRGLFSYVPQGNLVLSGTIRDNITLCNPQISEEQLEESTRAAEIYDYIETLPQGFDTEISERGAGLSEGQIQRISIARALLADAPVLLLDEATSALDEETETKLLGNIKRMTGKTIIFITHRNTSLKACDRIIHVTDKKFTIIK